jgi:2-iminobutanoate/2-iminopropanoate deaminase
MEAQARLAMDNLGAALKSAGLGWSDVVKCTVMLDNMTDWPAFNKVYVTYFPDQKFPARSAFGADGLALGALLEVECLANAGKR